MSYIEVCGMESLRTSGNVYFSHVCSWKINILINLGAIFKNDQKIRIKMSDSLSLHVSTQCDTTVTVV